MAEAVRRGVVWRDLALQDTLGEITNQGGLRHVPEGDRRKAIRATVARRALAIHEKRPQVADEVHLCGVCGNHSRDDLGLFAEPLAFRSGIALEKSAKDSLDR